jgi:hypothetical protein
MRKSLFFWCSYFLLHAAACGGNVTSGPEGSETGGAGGAGGAAASSSSSGQPIVCVPKENGAGGFTQPTCADLDRLVITDPVVLDESGDGAVTPGEKVTIQAKLVDVSGLGFNWYPAVRFETAAPTVTVTSDAQFYAIGACQELDVQAFASIDPATPKGTLVEIVARVAMLNADCPDAFSIEVPIEVF